MKTYPAILLILLSVLIQLWPFLYWQLPDFEAQKLLENYPVKNLEDSIALGIKHNFLKIQSAQEFEAIKGISGSTAAKLFTLRKKLLLPENSFKLLDEDFFYQELVAIKGIGDKKAQQLISLFSLKDSNEKLQATFSY